MTLFRRRQRPLLPEALTSSDAPVRARIGYVQLLRKLAQTVRAEPYADFSYDAIESEMLFVTRRMALLGAQNASTRDRIEHHLQVCDPEEFYECIEAVDGYLNEEHPEQVEAHRRLLDGLLADEGVLLEFGAHSSLHTRFTAEFEQSANAALGAAPKLYADQLRKAIDRLGVTRHDAEAAVKEAMGALEGVVGEVVGRSSLEDLAPLLRDRVHPQITEALRKLYAYRGRVAAHAAQPETPYRGLEAIFVVHVCAAAIALLLGVDSTEPTPEPAIPDTGTFDPDEIPF
jgi:hypothetical protein